MTPACLFKPQGVKTWVILTLLITEDVIWVNLHFPLGLSFFSYKQKDDL